MMALVRLFLPSTKPLLKRTGKQSKKAIIAWRQLRKAERALRSCAGPWRWTAAIQVSKPVTALQEEAVSYQVRKSSLSCQALPISGKVWAKVARAASSPAERF